MDLNTVSLDITDVANNDYVFAIMSILMVSYGSMSKVKLPAPIKALFKNPIFRTVFLSLLMVYSFENKPHVAVLIAVIFVTSMQYINAEDNKAIKEGFNML
jgi:hypothetical protein